MLILSSRPNYADHPVQTLMSRVGSFPLWRAYSILRRYGRSPKITLDPFCGKGTSLLAARILGSEAYGIDTAPEAIVCSQAKLGSVTLEETVAFLDGIRLGSPALDQVPATVRVFYDDTTLRQLVSIKNALNRSLEAGTKREREAATLVFATLLGILHGHASYSLSISSAHAFAMSPNYVIKYARRHGLEPPRRDVKACLRAKLHRCMSRPLPPPVTAEVIRGQAQKAATLFGHLRGKVDCIITSPPTSPLTRTPKTIGCASGCLDTTTANLPQIIFKPAA